MSQRINFLDGLRGLAILMVVLFHAYARWPGIVPYGSNYEIFFEAGWLGVQLFFLISGFVILLTLEKCSTFKEFIFRRWLRLFPAMLFCSAIIYLSAQFFYERPFGTPSLISLLPGLLFIEPSWIGRVIGQPVNPLEGAFWSIYVEFKFYLISGCIYFFLGRTKLVWGLFALSTIGFAFQWIGKSTSSPYLQLLNNLSEAASLKHYGWFAAGASAYLYTKKKSIGWFITACALVIYSSLFVRSLDSAAMLGALVVSSFFLTPILCDWAKNMLGSKLLQFFGFISYPLYLSHENAMISSVIKLGRIWSDAPKYIYPLVPISGLCVFSYLCAKYAEPMIRSAIYNILTKTSKLTGKSISFDKPTG